MDPVEALMEKLRQDNSLLAKAKELTEADTIRSYDGQIPQELLDAAIDEIDGRNWRYGWKSSKMLGFGHWNIVLSDSKIEREEVYHEVPQCIRDLWDYIQPRFMPTTPVLVRAYSNAHTYGVEGYIHRDSKFATDQTCIIYVEKDWKPEWAGETVFFDEDEDVIKAILPRYGRFTIFPGNIKHVGRGVSRICPTIRRVLVLKGKPRE
jgi:SM-20-related protein